MASTLDKARTHIETQTLMGLSLPPDVWNSSAKEARLPRYLAEWMHAYALSITPEIRAETRREIADELDGASEDRVREIVEELRGEK